MKYFEERQLPIIKGEADRLTEWCTGVRRTTGQHPGGIIIVPRGHEIYEFCPVQHPANDTDTDIITTHFDYHSIDENLLKLDILARRAVYDPAVQDIDRGKPSDLTLKDKKVDSIFKRYEGLDIKDPDYRFTTGVTEYRSSERNSSGRCWMITKQAMFADMIRISGFSHGTERLDQQCQEFIRNGSAR
jgi:DNA polymerase-3 subunit alpha (Gram-positive type)